MNLFAGIPLACFSIAFLVIATKELIEGLDMSKGFGRGYKLKLNPGMFIFRTLSLYFLGLLMGMGAIAGCTGYVPPPLHFILRQS